jgi:hypothetical protein
LLETLLNGLAECIFLSLSLSIGCAVVSATLTVASAGAATAGRTAADVNSRHQ